jgi:hypothetical protein
MTFAKFFPISQVGVGLPEAATDRVGVDYTIQ